MTRAIVEVVRDVVNRVFVRADCYGFLNLAHFWQTGFGVVLRNAIAIVAGGARLSDCVNRERICLVFKSLLGEIVELDIKRIFTGLIHPEITIEQLLRYSNGSKALIRAERIVVQEDRRFNRCSAIGCRFHRGA